MKMFSNIVTAGFVILVFSYTCVSEPHCSKFDYDEKLLEKMIRLEISVETMKKEIEESRKQVTKSLVHLQTERRTWEKKLLTMKDPIVTALDTAVQETKTQLQEELKAFAAEKERWNKKLKGLVKMPKVVLFSARTLKDSSQTDGQMLVFTEIILNKGGAYNKDSGAFKAPYAGVYTFSVQLCLFQDRQVDFAFMANEQPFKKVLIYNQYSFSCHSFDAMTILEKNDKVSMKIVSVNSSTNFLEHTNYWNMFSGRLVQTI